ncbi:MAG: hypothetical protein ACE5LF_09810 [Alphaproteobacteria bacterium]
MTAPGTGRRAGRGPNSLAAFATVVLGHRQQEVLGALVALWREGRRPCDADVAERLRLGINQITPRRHELARAGLIVRLGNKPAAWGRRVTVWAPVARQRQRQGNLFIGGPR